MTMLKDGECSERWQNMSQLPQWVHSHFLMQERFDYKLVITLYTVVQYTPIHSGHARHGI